MRLFPLFLLLATFSAQADSLMIASDPEQSGILAKLPKILAEELAAAGAMVRATGKEEVPGVLELRASEIVCERQGMGKAASCSFKGPEEKRATFAATGAFYAALEDLQQDTEGLVAESCDSAGACRLSLAYLYCIVNTEFADRKVGKFSCGIMGNSR